MGKDRVVLPAPVDLVQSPEFGTGRVRLVAPLFDKVVDERVDVCLARAGRMASLAGHVGLPLAKHSFVLP